MPVLTMALGVHYIGVDFLNVIESSEPEINHEGDVVVLLYFSKEVDAVSTPLRLTLLQARQLYSDLKQAFD